MTCKRHECCPVQFDLAVLDNDTARADGSRLGDCVATTFVEKLQPLEHFVDLQPTVPIIDDQRLVQLDPSADSFGKQDFIYQPETDTYRCPAGE